MKQIKHVIRASRVWEVYFMVYYCLYFELHIYVERDVAQR